MRRTYVLNHETGKFEEVARDRAAAVAGPYVHGDFKPVVSPVTGLPITDRGALRRHLKAHNLAPYDDMKGVAARARKAREDIAKRERIRAVADAYEHTRNQERAKQRFG